MQRSVRVDGVLDIECAGWSHFVVGAMYRPITGPRIVRTADELADRLREVGGWWWAWNGGRYDFLAIADVLHRRGERVTCHTSGSQITRLECGDLKLVDAWYLCPMAKNRAAEIAGRQPNELGWECVCECRLEGGCGGYCQIQPRMPEARLRLLADYCVADCELEYAVIASLLQHARDHRLVVKGTVGGTAWESARAELGLPAASIPRPLWTKLRAAYYGGRVTVGMPTAQRGRHYDLASSYPAALATVALPVGTPCELGRRDAAVALGNERPGVYRATVRVPDDLAFPPLPWRWRGRLAYPTGQVTGTWTQIELAAAEDRGCEVEHVHGALTYPDGAHVIFDGLIDRWYSVRASVGRRTALGEWWRLLCNSLTGKFAEGPQREAVLMHPSRVRYCNPDLDECRRWGCTRTRCTGRCGAYRMLDRWGTIWSQPYWRRAESGHVQWAAYVTSAARVSVLRGMERVGHERFVYSDTDSVWVADDDVAVDESGQGELALAADLRVPGEVGSDIGQWELRGEWYEWLCRGPKAYRYRDDSGAPVVRLAGVSRATDREWSALGDRDARVVSDRGVQSLREAAMGDKGLFVRSFRPVGFRESDGWLGDRLVHGNGRTYPPSCEAIKEKVRKRARQASGAGRQDPSPGGQEPSQPSLLDPQEA